MSIAVNYTIALVDDDPAMTAILDKSLNSKGFSTQVFNSSIEFLDKYENNLPELILLDIDMPDKNGFEVLAEVRKKYETINLPVIMLTSKSKPEDVIKGLETGANDYLTKPANMEIAAARIMTQLNLKNYYKKSLKTNELEVLNTMMVTYSHEINNPLTVALGNLKDNLEQMDEQMLQKAKDSLWQISDISKKIKQIVKESDIEYVHYSENSKMLKLK